MALADYYLCDLCERKTFYDARLDYPVSSGPVWLPEGAGDMAVICETCAGTHEVIIAKRIDA